MNVEVINTGTELLLGDIVNTNFQYLSRMLNDAGFNVLYQTTIGDNGDRLLEVLAIALKRADIIITNHPDRLAEQLRDLSGAKEGQTGENERTGK